MLLGFDIGGTKSAVILGREINDEQINIIDKITLLTDKPAYEMIDELFAEAENLLHKNNVTMDDIEGIGISCGGPLDSKKGLILSPPNLPGWDNIPITDLADRRFNKPVLLQNDANAGAVAEWKYGAGKGYQNVIFMTFGTGMGAGLILDGRLYSGTTDLAGEAGHLRLSEMGPAGFGKAGSFEGWCSGGGIAQLAQIKVRQKLQMGEKVSFCNNIDELPSLTAKLVAEAATNGDATAVDIFNTCGIYLGRGLALIIDLLNPELIILGSIFGRARHLLEDAMHNALQQEAITASYKACKIIAAALGESIGDMAALSLAVQAKAIK